MKFIFLAAIFSFVSFQATAASERIISCVADKGGSIRDGYRLNVRQYDDGRYKAILSGGYTTQNSLFTWTVDVVDDGTTVTITSLNKSDLELTIAKNRTYTVEDFKGSKAKITGSFDITPATRPTKNYPLDEYAACQFE